MLIRESARKCVCKECGKEINMFMDAKGKLIYFPMNTVRPAYGFYELAGHLRQNHKELYGLLMCSEKKENAILNEYDISRVCDRRKAWSI